MAATVFTDTGGTIPAFPGDGVAFIRDQSPNGNHTVQSNLAARGLLVQDQYGNPAIRLDLSDDFYPRVYPTGFVGDVMIFGRNGSWLERNVTVAPGGSLNLGPSTINGGPVGLLAELGDIIGWLPREGTLSNAEITRTVDYYRPRGAKGLFTLGPELLTNSDFSAGLTGWENDNRAPRFLTVFATAQRCVVWREAGRRQSVVGLVPRNGHGVAPFSPGVSGLAA